MATTTFNTRISLKYDTYAQWVEKDDPLFVWPIPQHEIEAPGANIEPNESNK